MVGPVCSVRRERCQATNNDGSSSWGSHHRSSHSHRSGGSSHHHHNSHRSSRDGTLADNIAARADGSSKPFVAQAPEHLRLVCFRLLALPRHRRSRPVQCQPQLVPPECTVSFLATPSTAGCSAKHHSLAKLSIDADQYSRL